MRLFCFGLGYTAQALASTLAAEGWQIAGTTRDPDKQARLEREGIEVYAFERDRPLEQAAQALAGTTHVLSSIAPDEGGDPVLGHHARDLLRCTSIAWAGYLGTTGVYGDRGGDWVSEADPTAPTMLLRASMARPNPGAVYNVSDDEPAPPQDVVTYACTLLGVEPPPEIPFDAAELSPMARSFYSDSRRICNARIREELGVRLRYPSYREGLRALLDEEASG
jgi:nucleoside-diphosphate-sugar epimerase